MGDLLLEELPGDGSSPGNLSAREAPGKAAGLEVSEEAYEEEKERLLLAVCVPLPLRQDESRNGLRLWPFSLIVQGRLAQSPRPPVVQQPVGRFRSDATTCAAAHDDPQGFIRRLDGAVIDEVQRGPELLLAIKLAVEDQRWPGRFLLTGSADVMALPRVGDSLAGRLEVLSAAARRLRAGLQPR